MSAKKGLFWYSVDIGGQQVLNFISGIILARLLKPTEFGQMALISGAILLLSIISESGITDAIINRKSLDDNDKNTLFWTNFFKGVAIYFMSLLIVNVFKSKFNHEIVKYFYFGGIYIIFNSVSSIFRAFFMKDVDFRRLSYISLISVVISVFCAILLANQGWGVFALLIRMVLGEFITLILLIYNSQWAPTLHINLSRLIDIYSFGLRSFLVNLMTSIYLNAINLIVGKSYGVITLGLYNRGEMLSNLPFGSLGLVLQKVSFAIISKSEKSNQSRLFYDFYFLCEIFTILLFIFLHVFSREIVLIILGKNWLNCVEIFQGLIIVNYFMISYNLILNYCFASGNVSFAMNVNFFLNIVCVIVLIIFPFNVFEQFINIIGLLAGVKLLVVIYTSSRIGIFNRNEIYRKSSVLMSFIIYFLLLELVSHNIKLINSIYNNHSLLFLALGAIIIFMLRYKNLILDPIAIRAKFHSLFSINIS